MSFFNFGGGQGIPCGSGYISASKKCRVGLSGYPLSHLAATDKNKAEKLLSDFEDHLETYSPDAQQFFRSTLKGALESLNEDERLSSLRKQKATLRVLTNVGSLAKDGPPKSISLKDGTPVEVSSRIYPVLSRTGNMGWKDPVQNVTFTKNHVGQTSLVQNRVTLAQSLANGQLQAAVNNYNNWKSLPSELRKDSFGSSQHAKLRDVDEKERDEFWNKLSGPQKRAFAVSGLDAVGDRRDAQGRLNDERSAHTRWYQDHPDQLEWRGKEVAMAFLRQTPSTTEKAVSPWTGLPLEVLGSRGKGQSVVDHSSPISRYYLKDEFKNKPWTFEEGLKITRRGDIADNFVIGESGINNGKGGSENWDSLTKGWTRRIDDFNDHLKTIDRLPVFGGNRNSSSLVEVAKQEALVNQLQKETSRKVAKTQKANKKPKPEVVVSVPAPKLSGTQKENAISQIKTAIAKAKADRDPRLMALLEAQIKKLAG